MSHMTASIRVALFSLAFAVALASTGCTLSSGPFTEASGSTSEASLADVAEGDLEDFALLAGEAFFSSNFEEIEPYIDPQSAFRFDTFAGVGGFELSVSDLRVAEVSEDAEGTSVVRYAGEFCSTVPTSTSASGSGAGDANGEVLFETHSTSVTESETSCITVPEDGATGEQAELQQQATTLRFRRGGDGRWLIVM